MKSSKKRRARRTSKQRSAASPPPSFTDAEEAFFAVGVHASETGQFETITDETDVPRPGLLKRILLRVQRS